MITKNAKTLLFASLIVAMVLPFASMDFASADQGRDNKKQKVTDEPTTYDFLKNLMNEGKYVKDKKTKDNKDPKHTNSVTKIDKDKFLVDSEFEYEGKIVNQQNVMLIKNSDKSITMINEEQGLDVNFLQV